MMTRPELARRYQEFQAKKAANLKEEPMPEVDEFRDSHGRLISIQLLGEHFLITYSADGGEGRIEVRCLVKTSDRLGARLRALAAEF